MLFGQSAHPERRRRGGLGGRPPTAEGGGVHTPPPGLYSRGGRASSAPPRPRTLTALTPQGAKRSGALVERGGSLVYVRKVDSARHMLRLPEPSWAVDEEKLHEAQAEGADRVEIHDEAGRVWWTSVAYFLSRGQRFDRGWGAQVRLPVSHFSFLPPDTAARQLALFGGIGG
jgi:hypothetical protein